MPAIFELERVRRHGGRSRGGGTAFTLRRINSYGGVRHLDIRGTEIQRLADLLNDAIDVLERQQIDRGPAVMGTTSFVSEES